MDLEQINKRGTTTKMISSNSVFHLQVNHSPSFTTDSRLDREIKDALIYDTIMLLNLGSTDKRRCVEEERKRVRERLFLKQGKKETKFVRFYVYFRLFFTSTVSLCLLAHYRFQPAMSSWHDRFSYNLMLFIFCVWRLSVLSHLKPKDKDV